DDENMILAIQRLLSAAGFRTATFRSAEAMLQAGAARAAACLVLDVHLPSCSGIEVYRLLADSGVRPPVVFITAHDDPEAKTQAATVGAVAYLTKPFEGRELLMAVRKALGKA